MATDPLVTEYDLRDLVRAKQEAARWENAATELAGYYRSRYLAMAAAFGATSAPVGSPGEGASSWLAGVLRDATHSLSSLRSPFEGYLEVPNELWPVIDAFGPAIDEGLRATRNALLDLLVHVTAEVWGVDADTRITGRDLMVQGFDPTQLEPDLTDFM